MEVSLSVLNKNQIDREISRENKYWNTFEEC